MRLSIYKPGQGYWTRMGTLVGFGTLVLAGVAWICAQLERLQNPLVYQAVTAVVVVAVFGVLFFWLLNTPRIVDFMIATEAEMKKVNWPTKREIVGATIVVIAGTLMIALLLFLINFVFGWIFLKIGVLGGGSAAL